MSQKEKFGILRPKTRLEPGTPTRTRTNWYRILLMRSTDWFGLFSTCQQPANQRAALTDKGSVFVVFLLVRLFAGAVAKQQTFEACGKVFTSSQKQSRVHRAPIHRATLTQTVTHEVLSEQAAAASHRLSGIALSITNHRAT